MAVEPANFLLQGVVPGKVYDLEKEAGLKLRIYNRDGVSCTFLISSHRPSEAGNRRWTPGYQEIPDPEWLKFEKKEIKVGPYGSGEVRMFLEIPPRKEFFNQHWMVTLQVKRCGEGGFFVSLCPKGKIETLSKKEEIIPYGEVGTLPSTLNFNSVGESKEIIIFNNSPKSLRLALRIRTPGFQGIPPTPGYTPVGRKEYFLIEPKVLYFQEGERGKKVKITWLKKKRVGKQESLLILEDPQGVRAFARLKLEVKERD